MEINEESLDTILRLLLYYRNSKEHTDNTGYNIEVIAKAMGFDVDDGDARTLEDILIADGHIQHLTSSIKGVINITAKGTKFILEGGYVRQKKKEKIKVGIDRLHVKSAHSTISANRWSKVAVVISIISLIVSALVAIVK